VRASPNPPRGQRIDKRARLHGLPRSRYLALIARHDLAARNGVSPLATSDPAAPPKPLDLTAEVYDFLLLAIPALTAKKELNMPTIVEQAGQPRYQPPATGGINHRRRHFFLFQRLPKHYILRCVVKDTAKYRGPTPCDYAGSP
jgi:hypothetical protein